jgi:hypothetical protein
MTFRSHPLLAELLVIIFDCKKKVAKNYLWVMSFGVDCTGKTLLDDPQESSQKVRSHFHLLIRTHPHLHYESNYLL